jgi:transketolase
LQGFGSTAEVASMAGLRQRIEAFGAKVRELDGHQPAALQELLATPEQGFQVILLNTVKGKGVSFMEAKMEWHYLPLTAEQFAQAQNEVRQA